MQIFDRVGKLFEAICMQALLTSAEIQSNRAADDMNNRIMHFGPVTGKSATRRAIDTLSIAELREKDCIMLHDLFVKARLPVVIATFPSIEFLTCM
jgi:hypothetical protein